ncbi:phage portal protein [Paenibacillus sonchi]|uniref:Phage portal protein n=1 Tax=Paenibacillus sonchi TaxID=373687 RepID=A0A974PHQ1_9BACL|nr:phage portal protein [Paenibacillus sonchi]
MNPALAILYMYPSADPTKDFMVQDDGDGKGPYIAAWNLDKPKPTEAELQAAWKAYQEAEANKPPELTELEQLQKENLLLKSQNNALSERADFIEDIIAEMAMRVYQ